MQELEGMYQIQWSDQGEWVDGNNQYILSLIHIFVFISILVGMAISVSAFGTGGKRAKMFENIYFSVEDVDGIGVVYTKKRCV